MDFVLVKRFEEIMDAELAQAKLESEGIPCHLQDEMTSLMTWMVKDAIGAIKLMVEEEYAAKAVEILGQKGIEDESLDFQDSPE